MNLSYLLLIILVVLNLSYLENIVSLKENNQVSVTCYFNDKSQVLLILLSAYSQTPTSLQQYTINLQQ